MTEPEMMSRGLRPILSIRQSDTAERGQGGISDINLTECSEELDPSHHSSGQIVVHAALEGLEDMDSLEDDDIDPAPVLDSLEDQSDEEGIESVLVAELSQLHPA